MARDVSIVTRTMRAVKSANTKPELVLRKALWGRGLRYRLHRNDLPGKPDIVFVSAKVAVFVDGDYWHGNQWRLRGFDSMEDQLASVQNKEYWVSKIKSNVKRDKANSAKLRRSGWRVIRIWESDIKRRPGWAVNRVVKAVTARPSQS